MAKKKVKSKKSEKKPVKKKVVEAEAVVEGEVVETQPVQTQISSDNGKKVFCCCGIGCVILVLIWFLLSMLPFILPIPYI